jgi:hypothetical protein
MDEILAQGILSGLYPELSRQRPPPPAVSEVTIHSTLRAWETILPVPQRDARLAALRDAAMRAWAEDENTLAARVALGAQLGHEDDHAVRPIPVYDLMASMRAHGYSPEPAHVFTDEFFEALEGQAIDHVRNCFEFAVVLWRIIVACPVHCLGGRS